MAPANHDFHPSGRLDRAIRTVLVAAIAALIGVIAGGASVFAIVSALTSPARHDMSADAALRQSHTDPAPAAAVRTMVPVPPEYSDRQGDEPRGGFFGLFDRGD